MKIVFVTSNRSEYGLLKRLVLLSNKSEKLEAFLIVTGDHLSEIINSEKEIIEDNIPISAKIKLSPKNDNPYSILIAMGDSLKSFSKNLSKLNPDAIVILGDRYESLVVATASLLLKIPLIHISGGEITKGSIDDTIRHSITKMADYHFVAIEEFKNRVLKMGEDPSRIFVVGGMGVDAISNIKLLGFQETLERLQIKKRNLPLVLCTYHPATAKNTSVEECKEMLSSLQEFQNLNIVITYPNPDFESKKIINLINEFSIKNENFYIYPSLGQFLYLSTLSHSLLVIGNSSSGITEAPYFNCHTINIGTRQLGRPKSSKVINVKGNKKEITKTINDIINKDKNDFYTENNNPYGHPGSSELIVKFLENNINNLSKKESFV